MSKSFSHESVYVMLPLILFKSIKKFLEEVGLWEGMERICDKLQGSL